MLTIKQIAEIYGYSTSHVTKLVRGGKIKGQRVADIWLIDPQSAAEYAANPPKSGPHKLAERKE